MAEVPELLDDLVGRTLIVHVDIGRALETDVGVAME